MIIVRNNLGRPSVNVTRICDLPVGRPAIITAIDRGTCGVDIWRRLHEMGFDEGVDVEVLHKAPLGDPIALRVGNMTIAIRRAEAALIAVDAVGAPLAMAAE